jgi:hypothetical protein
MLKSLLFATVSAASISYGWNSGEWNYLKNGEDWPTQYPACGSSP